MVWIKYRVWIYWTKVVKCGAARQYEKRNTKEDVVELDMQRVGRALD